MAIYFFTAPYDDKKVGKKLEKLGFHQDGDYASYELGDFDLRIAFTDNEEGRFQVNGNYIDDIIKNKEKSEHYSLLEVVADVLKPNEVVDPCGEPILTELVKKNG